MEGSVTIGDRICAARLDIDRIAKRGKNDFHHYRYATAEDIQADVGEALANHGLYLSKKTLSCDWSVVPTAKGGNENRCLLSVTYRIHTSPQEFIEHEGCFGEGRDSGDKAYYKAATGSFKYFLIQAFCLGIGDDPEGSGDDEREATVKVRRETKRPEDKKQEADDKATAQQLKALIMAAHSKMGKDEGDAWLKFRTVEMDTDSKRLTYGQFQRLMQELVEYAEPTPGELSPEEQQAIVDNFDATRVE